MSRLRVTCGRRLNEDLAEAAAEPIDGHGHVFILRVSNTNDNVGGLGRDALHGC